MLREHKRIVSTVSLSLQLIDTNHSGLGRYTDKHADRQVKDGDAFCQHVYID